MRRLATVLFAATLLVSAAPTPAHAAPSFNDIGSSIFRTDITWAAARGLTGGCAPARFCPTRAVTRGEMATFIARLRNLPATGKDFFRDDETSVHEADINRVAKAGIAMGCASGRFCPNAPVTRAQMASFLARAVGLSGTVSTSYFWDDSGSPHQADIDRVAKAGIASGCGAGRFCPNASVTRGQMTAFLRRTVQPLAPPKPVASPPSSGSSPLPSTGGAGYGHATVGGKGGKLLLVTNLNDSGPGSLRAALETSGARVVTFAVSGTITLSDDVEIKHSHVTVAGETAPGTGVVLRGGALKVLASEVIVRHLRLRPGDDVPSPSDVDALTLNGLGSTVSNVVIDHVTMLWGPDIGGLAIVGDVQNVTISHSIMGEGLFLSRHAEGTTSNGGHSMGANVTQMKEDSPWPRRITFWRNLFTTSDERMPRLQGAECVDLVNNVIYNWGSDAAVGNPRSANVVNNWYRSGPETERFVVWRPQTSAVAPSLFGGAVYEAGNAADGFSHARGSGSVYASSARCGGLSVSAASAASAYGTVLAQAGATLPVRDSVDTRVIGNVQSRSGSFMNGAGNPGPNPYWP